jgi:uncharacterized protein YdeI (YjbR/CyaY-like superfamily)
MEIHFFSTATEFQAWLSAHHASAQEVWVGFYKKASGRPSMTWQEAVDEALCFGWIDSVRYSIDEVSYRQRFTPRRPGSNWSAINVRRVQELAKDGRMRPPGLEAFARRRADREPRYSFEQGEGTRGDEMVGEFRANPNAWRFWRSQPPGYRKIATWWVVSAKREETRRRRLATLIADSEVGQRIAMLRRGKG